MCLFLENEWEQKGFFYVISSMQDVRGKALEEITLAELKVMGKENPFYFLYIYNNDFIF